MDSSSRGRARSRPCRASQVPRSLSPCAPSPITPESRTTADACVLIARAGFPFSGRLAALIFVFRGRTGFACATAHRVRLPRLHRRDCSPSMLGQLHVPQALHMVTSFRSQERPGFTWRTRGHGERPKRTAGEQDKNNDVVLCALCVSVVQCSLVFALLLTPDGRAGTRLSLDHVAASFHGRDE